MSFEIPFPGAIPPQPELVAEIARLVHLVRSYEAIRDVLEATSLSRYLTRKARSFRKDLMKPLDEADRSRLRAVHRVTVEVRAEVEDFRQAFRKYGAPPDRKGRAEDEVFTDKEILKLWQWHRSLDPVEDGPLRDWWLKRLHREEALLLIILEGNANV